AEVETLTRTADGDLEPATVAANVDSRALRPETRRYDLWRTAQPWIVAAWLCGMCCMAVRLGMGGAATVWLRTSAQPLIREPLDRLSPLADWFGLRLGGRILVSYRIREACALGLLRPVILLPAAWIVQLPPDALDAIVAHELAHIRRWDLWANAFQRVVEL